MLFGCVYIVDNVDVFDPSDVLTGLDGTNLFKDLDLAVSDVDFFVDWEDWEPPSLPLVHDGNVEMIQRMETAGIQQPAQRQICLHMDLVEHLSKSPPNDDLALGRPANSVPTKPQPSPSSSESELVRMLSSKDSTALLVKQQQLLPRPPQHLQHVPTATAATSAKDLPAAASSDWDSELVRQLTRCPNGSDDDDKHNLQHQRVALVPPTVTQRGGPVPPHAASSVKMVDQQHQHQHHQPASRLSVQEIEQTMQQQLQPKLPSPATQIVITTNPSQGPPTVQPQETTQAVPMPGVRQIVITTQAPVQTQHVPQISLQQLQQVIFTIKLINYDQKICYNFDVLTSEQLMLADLLINASREWTVFMPFGKSWIFLSVREWKP